MAQTGLRLLPGQWYGWQMLPGYDHPPHVVPYFSPIQVIAVTPKKAGNRSMQLKFWNVGYAVGVQDVTVDLRIVKHADDYLIADLVAPRPETSDRAAIISTISFGWLERLYPDWELPDPPTSGSRHDAVSRFLNDYFTDE
jgi:hypothetical protein